MITSIISLRVSAEFEDLFTDAGLEPPAISLVTVTAPVEVIKRATAYTVLEYPPVEIHFKQIAFEAQPGEGLHVKLYFSDEATIIQEHLVKELHKQYPTATPELYVVDSALLAIIEDKTDVVIPQTIISLLFRENGVPFDSLRAEYPTEPERVNSYDF